MNTQEMLERNQYEDILINYYEDVKKLKFNSTKSEKYIKQFNKLLDVFYSCYSLGHYINCLILGNKILAELKRKTSSDEVNQLVYQIYFESLLYCHINNKDIADYFSLNISEEIKIFSQNRWVVNNPRNNELLLVYKDFCNGLTPYYTLSFLIPYEPLFKEHIFDLSKCYPFISMNIKECPRELENGDIQDVFTSVEFRINGFIHKSPRWQGDNWENRNRLPHIKKCLPILNMLFLYAGNSTRTFVPTICIEQISSTTITQFMYDGKKIGWSMGTDFGSQWVGLNVPKHEYTKDELYQLNELVVQSYGCECFISLFQQAKNNVSAGLYVESFLLLCSCSESMIYYWCRHLCTLLGLADEYEQFSRNKISACDSCQLFINGDEKDKNHKGMEPSLYQHAKFVVDKCGLSKKQSSELNRLISKVRKDTLRNDIVHGRVGDVSLSVINQSMDCLMKLQDFFIDIKEQVIKPIR